MPLYTADALILRTYKLGEADRIVVFLTRDRGKKRGVAKNARKSFKRFGGGLEPLTDARVSYVERERRDLVTLQYVEPHRSPMSASSGDALGYAGYFAELLDEWAQEADPSETLYRLGASVLDALAGDAAVEPLARYFEFWLLRLQGVYPSHVACQACGRALEAGEPAVLVVGDHVFTCEACRPQVADGQVARLTGGALAFLQLARVSAPAELAAREWAPAVLVELERVHRFLLTTHLERDLKSPRVLRELRRA